MSEVAITEKSKAWNKRHDELFQECVAEFGEINQQIGEIVESIEQASKGNICSSEMHELLDDIRDLISGADKPIADLMKFEIAEG